MRRLPFINPANDCWERFNFTDYTLELRYNSVDGRYFVCPFCSTFNYDPECKEVLQAHLQIHEGEWAQRSAKEITDFLWDREHEEWARVGEKVVDASDDPDLLSDEDLDLLSDEDLDLLSDEDLEGVNQVDFIANDQEDEDAYSDDDESVTVGPDDDETIWESEADISRTPWATPEPNMNATGATTPEHQTADHVQLVNKADNSGAEILLSGRRERHLDRALVRLQRRTRKHMLRVTEQHIERNYKGGTESLEKRLQKMEAMYNVGVSSLKRLYCTETK
ncbi:hypothetical protein BJ508DRAFT_333607 [Ascobolus immersus RN42]|uniref:Uncharacterized protein n=1 Tax=Ascobolus immersus RN42 TaxID=1160509 RepID=A0A3N4HPD7_ASCIM|nr:hypothetical protein BJ508DRAFT_333607 [Ascobolus immersus RN42]